LTRARRPWLVCAALAAVAAAGCARRGPQPAPAPAHATAAAAPAKTPWPPAKPLVGCELPAAVRANVTLTRGCALAVKEAVTVSEGAVLTIEPGVRLGFAPESYLFIARGQLVARGTREAPIVFTAAAPNAGPGGWVGLVLEDAARGTVLEHAVVEYAGKTGSYGHGGITIKGAGAPGRIGIVSCTIRQNEQAGLANLADRASFARLERNTFSGNRVSLRIQADLLGSVGAGNRFGDPVHVEGSVTVTQTWPRLEVPIFVDANLAIGGEKQAAILTLPEKATLEFAPETYLWIGSESGGGLVARGVTFTSQSRTPQPGDWVGLIVEQARATTIEGCTVEFAGHEGGYGKGAVTFRGEVKPGPAVRISGNLFRKSRLPAFAMLESAACGDLAKQNRSEGAPLCARPE
jgi:hypothetical protein